MSPKADWKSACLGLAVAGNKRATRSLCRPSPRWVGEENGKKKAKLMGRDKGSLTETANKGNSNDSNTEKENIQNKQ